MRDLANAVASGAPAARPRPRSDVVEKAVFLGFNALGDTLCTTPVIRAFRQRHPHAHLLYVVQGAEFCRILDGNPDIDLVLYSEGLYLRGWAAVNDAWLRALPLDLRGETLVYRFDLAAVCTSRAAFQRHIAQGFGRALGIEVASTRPVVVLRPQDHHAADVFIRRPYVVLSPTSVANPVGTDGRGAKSWPDDRWRGLARAMTAGGYDVLCVGSEHDTPLDCPGARMLYGLPIRVVAALLARAACLVTIENGLAHLAAALDVPTVLLYSNIVPLAWARHPEFARCRVLYDDPREIRLDEVLGRVHELLAGPQPLHIPR